MKRLSLLVGMVCFLVSGAMAQEEMEAKKHENVTWQNVVLVDFKAGKVGEAKEIIKKYEAAGAAAQTPGPQKIWLSTGEYDLMLIWTMKDGPASMEWSISPDGAKWQNEFIKQQGSKEAADKIRQQYAELISKSTSYIGMKEN